MKELNIISQEVLGKWADDKVTGYNGKITAVMFPMLDDPQVLIERVDSDKQPHERWFNRRRVVVDGEGED